ncbi:AP2-like ethylene-responsive transcription factor [Chloropicon roscoffensis]|uniref:AP2-like ethylene-responsive transcription factor n=1 Tax=Chloropicon roscoffensis TaxID=1461544 RepID=A0AAX4P8P7_9CHLO
MRSEKIIETLQTLKELLDDGLITELTEQEYEAYRRKEIDLWVQRQRQSEGEGGDRGQAPDAAVGTSSGRGREVSGQGSDTKVEAGAPVRREPLPQKRGRGGPKNRSSLYRGVTFHKQTGRWWARVYTKGKHHSLGVYKDEEMAAEAFDKAVIKIRGKDADTNFPPQEYAEEMRSRGASEISVEKFILQLRSEAKRKAEVDNPKPAKTGYILFADHVRDRVKEDLTTDLAEGEKLHGRAIAKALMCAIAALWSKQDKETKEEWKARAKGLRTAVDQTPERAAVEGGPSTSQDAKAEGADGPGPSKRPRHEGEGEATHAEYYARVADLYHSHEDAAG